MLNTLFVSLLIIFSTLKRDVRCVVVDFMIFFLLFEFLLICTIRVVYFSSVCERACNLILFVTYDEPFLMVSKLIEEIKEESTHRIGFNQLI